MDCSIIIHQQNIEIVSFHMKLILDVVASVNFPHETFSDVVASVGHQLIEIPRLDSLRNTTYGKAS